MITTSFVQYLIYPYNCLEAEMYSDPNVYLEYIYIVFCFLFVLTMFFCMQFVNSLFRIRLFLTELSSFCKC